LSVDFGNLMKVTPNVRPAWYVTADDQNKSRGMTPREAIKAGANALVIGRPITNPPKEIGTPADAFKKICDEIATAL
jgi:orotidine-5'-phosphate decarboxylase